MALLKIELALSLGLEYEDYCRERRETQHPGRVVPHGGFSRRPMLTPHGRFDTAKPSLQTERDA